MVASKPKASGCVWSAPLGTSLPETASEALDSAFKSLGYLSSNGVVDGMDDASTDVPAFGGDIVMTVNTTHKVTKKFTPIEVNREAMAEAYGPENVTGEGDNINIKVNAKEKPSRCYVFEYVLSDGRIERDVVPNGKVTDVGDVTHADASPISSELTITEFPDEAGNKEYKYIATVA